MAIQERARRGAPRRPFEAVVDVVGAACTTAITADGAPVPPRPRPHGGPGRRGRPDRRRPDPDRRRPSPMSILPFSPPIQHDRPGADAELPIVALHQRVQDFDLSERARERDEELPSRPSSTSTRSSRQLSRHHRPRRPGDGLDRLAAPRGQRAEARPSPTSAPSTAYGDGGCTTPATPRPWSTTTWSTSSPSSYRACAAATPRSSCSTRTRSFAPGRARHPARRPDRMRPAAAEPPHQLRRDRHANLEPPW